MHFTVISSPRAAHQLEHQTALMRGLSAHGICAKASTYGHGADTDNVACWGWRIGRRLREKGHNVLVMERGYLGDRFAWTSLAWNGLNGYGDFGMIPEDESRFAQNFQMKPWKEGGEYVLLLGQVPGDASLKGQNLMPWYSQAAMLSQNAYELPVVFRQHPSAKKKGYIQRPQYAEPCTARSLDEALDKAAFAVTWNSNSSVDAVLAGVPTVTMDAGSMARDVTCHRIGEIKRPDRKRWANRLAWCQWRIHEISSGLALNGLLSKQAA